MKRRALIEALRASQGAVALLREEFDLLADAVEEADGSFRSFIETECLWVGPATNVPNAMHGWWDTSLLTDGMGDSYEVPDEEREEIDKALAYLDRRGLIERREGAGHMVRFIEED